MTDKEQIIIDGKGCKYKTWDAECSLTGDHYGDNMKPCKFIDEKSCYFKQLARKTQECENLRGGFHDINEQLKDYKEHYDKQYEEYQKLKQDLFLAQNQITLKNEYIQKVKQECEGLKEELATYKKLLDNLEFRVALTDVKTGEREVWRKLGSKADRYRKALEEIEGLVKNFCKDCDDYENCNWDKEGCYYSLIPNLKDIINKAKGE